MCVTFGLLGEVDARYDGQPVDLGSPQQRALLGLLLLAGGRTVSTDELVEQMWGPRGEQNLRSTVRTYVLRLRRAFAEVGVSSPLIETLGYGYRLVACGSTDLHVFTEHVALGRAARNSGDLAAASEHVRTALRQWRGSALSGARAFFVDAERSRLDHLRIAALEERIQLDLALGRGTGLESELLGLVAQYPLRERLHESLMLALYQSGRQADALSAYQRIRRILNDELGVTPGEGLREIQQRILRADPTLLPGTPAATTAHLPPRHTPTSGSRPTLSPPRPAPNQLPTDTPDFTGRAETVARLLAPLTGTDGPVTVGIAGLDGAGKTTLAVHVAHLAQHRYPDGQLYADLHGDDGLDRVGDLLGQFLRALGIHDPLPEATIERALLWRSCLARRRVLIVIDDVASVDQIRLLRPATPGSSAIVTSVRSLEVAAMPWEQATPLTQSESIALFDKIVGSQRYATHTTVSADLVAISGGHPELVRAVAHRILDRTNWSPEEILIQLRDALNAPNGINPSCRQMKRAVERSMDLAGPKISAAFRLIAVAQVSGFTPESVAELLDTTQTWSTEILHELADVHLLQRGTDRTFGLLNVVKAYARAIAREVDEPETVRAALNRIRLFYKESEANAKITRDTHAGPAGLAGQTQIWGGLRFANKCEAAHWLGHNKTNIRMLTDQLLQYSPAHAPIVVSHTLVGGFST
jgi:DNA-binding SARP family transcriptional activator